MGKHKTWEELELKHDFLFAKVMRNPDLCKEMLEKLLDIEIDRIEYPEEQKTIDITADGRSVRLDIYVRGGEAIYDIEIQTADTAELPKRSRYYQGMIDLNLIEKGEHFKKLNTSYVIFLCTFDLFGRGRHRYTFQNLCEEATEIRLGDGAIKMFFNTKGTEEDVSEGAKRFLEYIDGRESDDNFVQRLKKEIEKIKKNEEWRREYMTLLLRDQENLEKGREEGREKGIRETAQKMLAKGIEEDIILDCTGLSEEELNILKQELTTDATTMTKWTR